MLQLAPDDHPGVAGRYQKVLEPQVLEAMRRAFNHLNKGMVPLWRLGLARMMNCWPRGFSQLLVLEHVGRTSGTHYRTPVNFTRVGDDVYVLAAFGHKTHWYRNILAATELAVWLPDGRWVGTAEDASDGPHRLDLMRRVLIDSGFVAPMLGLHPREMSDADLDEATSTYCLLRIRPERRQDVADGPGSLAWVGLVASAALLVAVLLGVILRRTPTRAG